MYKVPSRRSAGSCQGRNAEEAERVSERTLLFLLFLSLLRSATESFASFTAPQRVDAKSTR